MENEHDKQWKKRDEIIKKDIENHMKFVSSKQKKGAFKYMIT